jgi:hypothetical protein
VSDDANASMFPLTSAPPLGVLIIAIFDVTDPSEFSVDTSGGGSDTQSGQSGQSVKYSGAEGTTVAFNT